MSAIVANRIYKDISKYPKNLEEFIAYIKKHKIYYNGINVRTYKSHDKHSIYFIESRINYPGSLKYEKDRVVIGYMSYYSYKRDK